MKLNYDLNLLKLSAGLVMWASGMCRYQGGFIKMLLMLLNKNNNLMLCDCKGNYCVGILFY